jgi:hypothetical protein
MEANKAYFMVRAEVPSCSLQISIRHGRGWRAVAT